MKSQKLVSSYRVFCFSFLLMCERSLKPQKAQRRHQFMIAIRRYRALSAERTYQGDQCASIGWTMGHERPESRGRSCISLYGKAVCLPNIEILAITPDELDDDVEESDNAIDAKLRFRMVLCWSTMDMTRIQSLRRLPRQLRLNLKCPVYQQCTSVCSGGGSSWQV